MNDPEAFPFVLLGNKVDVDVEKSIRVWNIPPPCNDYIFIQLLV